MKNRIFMYLFIFSVLLVIFQYVNSKNILDKYENDINRYKTTVNNQKQVIDSLEAQNFELNYFNIDRNDDALDYFEMQGYNTNTLIPVIKDNLYETNNYDGSEHPIVPYVSMTGTKLVINKVRLLNHKWIVANFTDGKYRGEIFLTYSINENNDLNFKLVESFMYPSL